MLAMFVFVLWFGILKDLDIDCGCFSAEELKEHGTLRGALFRDLWMIAGAMYLYGWRWGTGSIPQGRTRLKEATRNFFKGGNEKMLNRQSYWAVLMCAALTLGTVSTGFCLGKKELDTEKVAVKFTKEVDRGGYEIVTTEELKGWIDQNKDMIIVDTMPYEASFKKNHVPGAVQFLFPKAGDMTEWQPAETDGKTKEDYIKLLGPDKDKAIVVYCGFVKCDRSHNGAMWARKLGYKNVYRHPGGIKAWLETDYPVEKVK